MTNQSPPPAAPVPDEQESKTALRTITKQLWDLMYLHQPFHLEKAEALLEPYILSRIASITAGLTAAAVETLKQSHADRVGQMAVDMQRVSFNAAVAVEKAEQALAAEVEAHKTDNENYGQAVHNLSVLNERSLADLARKEAELAKLQHVYLFSCEETKTAIRERDEARESAKYWEKQQAHERAQRQKEVGMQEYRGNTVSYMYDKAKFYGDMVHGCVPALAAAGYPVDENAESRIEAIAKAVGKISTDLLVERAAHERTKGELAQQSKGCVDSQHGLRVQLCNLERDLTAARHAASEGEKDKARLDWLEQNAIRFEFEFMLEGLPHKNFAMGCSLRPVIDAAYRSHCATKPADSTDHSPSKSP